MEHYAKYSKHFATEEEKSFFKELVRYYTDFLETDFHRHSLPNRIIRLRDNNGRLLGINLRKYEKFQNYIRDVFAGRKNSTFKFEIKRKQYESHIKSTLKSFIDETINDLKEKTIDELITFSISSLEKIKIEHIQNYDSFREKAIEAIEKEILRKIISPLSNILEKTLTEEKSLGIETVFELENDMSEVLSKEILENSDKYLIDFFKNKKTKELKNFLSDVLSLSVIKRKMRDFFEKFASGDLFFDINELFENKRLNEKDDFYLYFCTMSYNKRSYPLFYFPMTISKETDTFVLTLEPRVLINKKAIEYVVQEYNSETNKTGGIDSSRERIVYLNHDEKKTVANHLQTIISNITRHFALEDIEISESKSIRKKSIFLNITNDLYICLFDKADESLLNDYEELQVSLNAEDNLVSIFADFMKSFIREEPVSYREVVDTEWNKKGISERLIYDSPIPLNEEQQKIISALREKNCRCISVQGPPGTGKSHTITAIVFDAIMKGNSILILSDKKEALDVVEDKITNTLNKVRISENFQNPILRLDKPNFTRIMTNTSLGKIRDHYETTKQSSEKINTQLYMYKKELFNQIEKTTDYYEKINIKELQKFFKLESDIERKGIQNIDQINLISHFFTSLKSFFECLQKLYDDEEVVFLLNYLSDRCYFWSDASVEEAIQKFKRFCMGGDKYKSQHFRLISNVSEKILPDIRDILDQYYILSNGFCKFLRKFLYKKDILALECKLKDILHLKEPIILLQEDYLLEEAITAVNEIKELAKKHGISKKEIHEFYDFFLMNPNFSCTDLFSKISDILAIIRADISEIKNILTNMGIDISFSGTKTKESIRSSLERVNLIQQYWEKQIEYNRVFNSIPEMHYVSDCEEIAKSHTLRMASLIDGGVLDFYEKNRNTAQTLKKIISQKQKFPRDEFEKIKKAFPCIIAGIRDYAEYIPLEKEIFDLVIIDEASQVSIAQAFPAILRSKKILVLGDNKQFSNVKTSHASKIKNTSYMDKLAELFWKNISHNQVQLERMKQLDIRTSVLEFFEHISNYNVMLRKHFRGYRENISFSNKYFYDGQLQAIKIRGKPIDDVLRFKVLPHDEKLEIAENTNTNPFEAKFIVDELERLVSERSCDSVGVITPFTNQQKFIADAVKRSKFVEDIYSRLKLKVMTFDSCQGEERDLIFYSMVASPVFDRTNYIFASDLEHANDDEKKIRFQRLNVGFSRAKECMYFILSKPISEFSGSIGTALSFYENQLSHAKKLPSNDDVDPSSPMEKKVLSWIQDAPFYQNNQNCFSIQAQFPIGDYLKQLDHGYDHPKYRCDFFLHYRDEKQSENIIIEYDGFKEHFTNLSEVNSENYESYYKTKDIEREKILEGYGCKFIRINRFNLGKNPADTISKRLENIVKKKSLEHQFH
jgi:hypothetical protein